MSGPVAIQALVTGLATGAAYGLIALGFSLVHRLTRVLAFAHGDIVTRRRLHRGPGRDRHGAGGGAARRRGGDRADRLRARRRRRAVAAVYALAVRPFRDGLRDVLGWVAGGLAAGLLVRELLGLPFAQQAYALPDPLGVAGDARARRRGDRAGAGADRAGDRARRGRAGRARARGDRRGRRHARGQRRPRGGGAARRADRAGRAGRVLCSRARWPGSPGC